MKDDRSLERAARSWIEAGPTQAPDRPVEAALLQIMTTQQEWDLAIPWRLPTMLPVRYVAAAAVAIAVGLGALLLATRPPSGPATATPTPAATTSPTASSPSAVRPLANGIYRASIAVADINARLLAATNLTADNKATIVNSILGIDGATTLNVELGIRDDQFTVAYGTNGVITVVGQPWRLYVLDATTIAVVVSSGSSGIQAWGVTHDGDSFRLRAMSPAPEPIEGFVRSVLFEAAPFAPIS